MNRVSRHYLQGKMLACILFSPRGICTEHSMGFTRISRSRGEFVCAASYRRSRRKVCLNTQSPKMSLVKKEISMQTHFYLVLLVEKRMSLSFVEKKISRERGSCKSHAIICGNMVRNDKLWHLFVLHISEGWVGDHIVCCRLSLIEVNGQYEM